MYVFKIFEKIQKKYIFQFLEGNLVLNSGQNGFRAERSYLSQLLKNYDIILQMLEFGKNVDIIYSDFAKVFDKIDFALILKKTKKLGIKVELLN